ncbi:hypothetical protein [Amycolatopsis sp. lyj-84]|uniref:hypothetical protein n=1 Tax=Amycolatopsis sp. lyj-84 TaxID=2789284 RepID=UPI003979D605
MTIAPVSPLAPIWDSPAFEHLAALVSRGWLFSPSFDDEGCLDRVLGAYTWIAEGAVDAIRIKGPDDSGALRCDHANGLLWEREGSLTYVLEELLVLPCPSDPLAPRLVLAAAPRLWTP